jgi:hypothetical protein
MFNNTFPKIVERGNSGNYMYRQFNFQQFYFLLTHNIYVFCVDLRINSDYFPYTALTECFFIAGTQSGYSAVRTEPSSIIQVNLSLQNLRLRSGG